MKKKAFAYPVFLAMIVFSLAQSGCVSIPDSHPPKLYMPDSMDRDSPEEKFGISSGTIIGIGPVKIPQYLNRPQMVIREKDDTLQFAQFQRWAEPLDMAMLRLLNEDISVMLPGAEVIKFSWNILIPVSYQVTVDVIKMDSRLDKGLLLVLRWDIIDLKTKELLLTRKTEITQPIEPHDYSGLSRALGLACTTLSRQIAKEISLLAAQARQSPDPIESKEKL